MASLWYKTRGSESPDKKQKVYFCAHPKDYDLLDTIAAELHRFQNCAIWYDQEPLAAYDTEEYKRQLAQMQLFVMPVTTALLTEESRALQHDFDFAERENIPVLPLMQENGLYKLFQEKCGDYQYLNKHDSDTTVIPYEEKLEKFLNAVLIDDDEAERIRAEFAAYIFLSYRKQDRKHAQTLMRLIHQLDFCRDVAIWYDEYLTPSEDFRTNISDALDKSTIFTLAVTENLLVDGNFVMKTEYPMALLRKKPCLPVELTKTNQFTLHQKFPELPDCIDPYNITELQAALKEHLWPLVKVQNNTPEHLYHIGVAYLNGVDIEKDHNRAIDLIRKAAETDFLPAVRKMVSIHLDGRFGKRDLSEAIVWQEKLLDLCHCAFEMNPESECRTQYTQALWDLGELYEQRNKIDEAISCYQELNNLYSLNNDSSDFFMEVVRVKCAIAKLHSERTDDDSQKRAWETYSDAVKYLSDHYSRKMSDRELHIIATMIEHFAQSILHGPKNATTTLSIAFLTAAVMQLRPLLETYNRINFDLIAKNSVLHNAGTQSARQFFANAGIMDIPGVEVNPEMGYIWTDPRNNAEELLFVALGIYEHLIQTDIAKYSGPYSNIFFSIASLWIMMGYTKKAVHLLNLSISYLEKIQSNFFQDCSYAIARQSVTLGQAYIQIQDIPNARSTLKKVVSICDPLYKKEVQYAVLLSEVYLILSRIDDSPSNFAEHLKEAAETLCVNNESYLSAHSIRISVIRIYTDLARLYLFPDLRDYDKHYSYFEAARRLCELSVERDKYEVPLYLCKLYNMAIISEDCTTIESMHRVAQLLNTALNNCKVLSNSDSEFSGPAWDITIETMLKIDYFVSLKLTGPIANCWKDAFAVLVVDAIEFFEKLADDSPLQLLPHKFRDPFSDFTYEISGVNSDFIERYNTFLHEFYRVYIEKFHDIHAESDNGDLRIRICAVYDQMIKCQEQGYAFRIFTKEKRKLLELLSP